MCVEYFACFKKASGQWRSTSLPSLYKERLTTCFLQLAESLRLVTADACLFFREALAQLGAKRRRGSYQGILGHTTPLAEVHVENRYVWQGLMQ